MDEFIKEMAKYGLHPNNVTYTKSVKRFRVGNESGKSGWYLVDETEGIVHGAFGNWKQQLNVPFYSKERSKFTPREKKSFEEKNKLNADRLQIQYHEAAKLANRIWKSATPVHNHPYAERKGIKITNLRLYRGKLIVPAYRDKQIISLQFIASDGSKIFLKNSEVKGSFHHIPALSWDIIYICEGYATGATINQAMGCPVIIAFNAGNLKNVAELVRNNYPNAQIIIAADNDRNTEGNPGVTAAGKASQAVSGIVITPKFKDKTSTDFNDLHQTEGLDAVKKQLHQSAAVTVISNDWRNYLIPGKYCNDDFPHPYEAKSKLNAYYFIQNMFPIFKYDEFCDQIIITSCPPWENNFMPRRVMDNDFFMLAAHLEKFGLRINSGDVYDIIVKISQENIINPPRDFFDTLVWDGQNRLDNWLCYFMGADKQPREYLALVGSKWLIGAVSRIYEPGCKFDSVLIFEGSQGIGKSNALRALSTFNGKNYFLDSVGDIRNKDTLMTMQGKIIIEMAELASLRKGDNEEIKGFISRQVDEYRPPYGRITIRRPRYFVLAGTTNEISDGYLTDNTGNRRYWPVFCGTIDSEGLSDNKEQLWAEAIHRYKQQERTWLSEEEIAHATREQESRRLSDPWQERIEAAAFGELSVTVDKIFEKLGISTKDINRVSRTRVKTCLEMLGWYETMVGTRRGWKKR